MIYAQNWNKKESRTVTYSLDKKWLSGELEELNGCDYCYCDNKEESEKYNTQELIKYTTVTLEGKGNETVQAIIFTWFPRGEKITTGLIVSADDKKGIKEARECFKYKYKL